MGTTHITGMGYGVIYETSAALEEAIDEAIDIEFLLEDHYPLLGDYHSGDAWSGETVKMLLIQSTVHHDYSFLIETENINTVVPEDELNALSSFCERFDLPFTPSWKIFSYMG